MQGGKRLVQAFAAIGVSGALIAWLLSKIDLQVAWNQAKGSDPSWIAAAALFSLALLALRSLRFFLLTSRSSLPLTTASLAIQVFLNRVTPFRLGELSLPLLLAKHAGEDTASSLVSVLFVRLLDLGVVVAAIALSLALRAEGIGTFLPTLILAVSLVLSLLTFRRWVGALGGLLERATRGKLGRHPKALRVLSKVVAATQGAADLNKREAALVWAYSLGIFFAHAGTFGSLLYAFGVRLSLPELSQGVAVAVGGAAVPVAAVGTFGTQEASWVAGFAWVGVPLEQAIVTGIAAQLLTLIFAACFAGPAWLWLGRQQNRAPAVAAETERA